MRGGRAGTLYPAPSRRPDRRLARSRCRGVGLATLSPMLAAQIWHWWIGLIMLLAGGLAAVGIIAGYLKTVSSQRYPGGKRGRQQEL